MLINLRNALMGGKADSYWGMYFEAQAQNVTVGMSATGTTPDVTLEASLNEGRTWQTFRANGTTYPVTLLDVGDRVYLRAGSGGNAAFSTATSNRHSFTLSGSGRAGGNIMSLLDANNAENKTLTNGYCFLGLFRGCGNMTSAPELPATTLTTDCYRDMFNSCAALELPPELPATTIANSCYMSMFLNCRALRETPALPAMVVYTNSYRDMFSGCTSLSNALQQLPATTLNGNCYRQMFSMCTSLAKAPKLPATSLTTNCYYGMFSGCSSLSEVEVSFSSWHSDATTNWLSNVSATGTFKCPTELGTGSTITRDASHCPNGWTVENA